MGCGLRTNQEGVAQLIERNVFCAEKPVVVKDSWHNQNQMHLDTYFNVIADKKVVLVANRLEPQEGFMRLQADIYIKLNDSYVLDDHNVDFVQHLLENSYKIIPVSVEDQSKYGVNFLTIESDGVVGIDGVSAEYKNTLAEEGVDVTWLDFSELTCCYGAAHCTTHVLERTAYGDSEL